ncbi:MAG: hypothetical protein RR300_06200 [Raoultibacter sp.]
MIFFTIAALDKICAFQLPQRRKITRLVKVRAPGIPALRKA